MGEPAQSSDQLSFKCPKCLAELVWFPRVAGRKVSCPCGHVFVAPTRATLLAAQQPVAPEPTREAPNRAAEMAALYARPRQRIVDDLHEEHGGPLRNWIVPSILLTLGLLILLSQVTWKPREIPTRVDLSFGQIAVIVVVMIVTLMAGVGVFTWLMNMDFGRLVPAGYKLLAIPVFAGSLAMAVARLDKAPHSATGMAMGWHLLVLLYWCLFAFLFKLEWLETLMVVLPIGFLQALVFWAIMG
jgi:hypothetical protein